MLLGADSEIGTFFDATAAALQNTLVWTYSTPETKISLTPKSKKKNENNLLDTESHVFDSGFSETDANISENSSNINTASNIFVTQSPQAMIRSIHLLTPSDSLTSSSLILTTSLVQTSQNGNDYQIIRLKKGDLAVCLLKMFSSSFLQNLQKIFLYYIFYISIKLRKY